MSITVEEGVITPDIQNEGDREILRVLLAELEERQNILKKLREYYKVEQPYAFLPDDVAEDLNKRLDKIATNIPRRVVNSIAERLRITGILTGGKKDPGFWEAWRKNDMPEKSAVVHREALAYGASYVIVWVVNGFPLITVESARQMIALRDPATREVLAAVKRWRIEDPLRPENEVDNAVLYLPDKTVWYEANPGTASDSAAWREIQTIPNPFGILTIVPFYNAELLEDEDEHGVSEMHDVIPLTDGANKLLLDLMTTSEGYARPRRWVTGVELIEEDVLDENGDPTGEKIERSPFDENSPESMPWTSENDNAKFGNFSATDLAGYETGNRVILGHVQLVSTLPAHYLGVFTNSPPTSESIKASEVSLTATAHDKIRIFTRPWEQVARLIYLVMNLPTDKVIDVRWGDPSTRTLTQEIDGVVKLHHEGIIDQETAQRRISDLWGQDIAEGHVCACEQDDEPGQEVETGGQAA